jgi:hypothetical protein
LGAAARILAPPVLVRAAMFALVALAGCKAKIGDPCTRSTDCSIQGDRLCDLSHRVNGDGVVAPNTGKGECTIEGCGADSCPKEAECVKVYGSDFLTVACDPAREDRAILIAEGEPNPYTDCTLDGACPPLDACEPREVCLPEGLCADEITARTSCRRRCKNDSECRNGYECRRAGSRGVYPAPDLDEPGETRDFKICVPLSVPVSED